ncbi:MAG: bifunctional hydroxymethylpyrimidine kinase/phosphomethylpyrimidine kinase [Vicinamibacterales bacterium]
MTPPRVVLTVAGSDPSSGAGVQADIKTFAAHGVYGTSAITALTVQNTQGVQGTEPVHPSLVAAQIAAVAEDFSVAAAKTGMLATAGIVEAVAAQITRFALPNLVVDPIVASSSGARLLDEEGVELLRACLLPLARVVTPNWSEAEALTGVRVTSAADARLAGIALLQMGVRAVVVTGGHATGHDIVDVLVTADGVHELRASRVAGRSTHGTGCAFSASLAAHLALDHPMADAVVLAQSFVADAIRYGFDLGSGSHGPMHHLASRR